MGTTFQRSQISTFPELIYFTSITSLPSVAFASSTIQYGWFPYCTQVGVSGGANISVFLNCKSLIALRFDSVTSFGSLNYGSSTKYLVITTFSVPSTTRWTVGKVYVLDNLVTSYKAATTWSSMTILPISQLATDYPACPWLDDLRTKGFIS